MLLKSISEENDRLLDPKLSSRINYLDFNGNFAPLETAIHPSHVVFSKDQLTEDKWLFNSQDEKLINQMRILKLTDSYLITIE